MAEYKLIYFDTPGYAQPIRYTFALAGVDFIDEKLPVSADLASRGLPPALKETLFWGQVPVLIYKGKTLCQSQAILRFVGRKFGFGGDGEWEQAKCDEYADSFKDFTDNGRQMFIEKDPAKQAEIKKTIDEVKAPEFFGRLEKILEENGGKWLVGSKITWVDLLLANLLELFEGFFSLKTKKENYKLVNEHSQRVFNLPQIKKWRQDFPVTDPLFTKKA